MFLGSIAKYLWRLIGVVNHVFHTCFLFLKQIVVCVCNILLYISVSIAIFLQHNTILGKYISGIRPLISTLLYIYFIYACTYCLENTLLQMVALKRAVVVVCRYSVTRCSITHSSSPRKIGRMSVMSSTSMSSTGASLKPTK